MDRCAQHEEASRSRHLARVFRRREVSVVSPAGTGVVNVTVSTAEATSEAGPDDQFSYLSSPPTVTNVAPAYGEAASPRAVTIAGTNFTGATEVRFGTISVAFSVKKSSTIKATAPIAQTLGAVDVTVTTPEGMSEITPADAYTFEPEFPSVELAAPEHGPGAGGNVVTLHGKGFIGTTQVSFGGSPAESFEVVNDAQIEAVAPAHTTERVAITVTTPEWTSRSECATPGCPPVAHYEFKPTITSVSPSSGPLQGGTAITVTGSGFSTTEGGTTISIDKRDATSVTCSSISRCTAVTPPGTKKAAGTHPVEVRVAGNVPAKEDHSEPSEAAQFTYE